MNVFSDFHVFDGYQNIEQSYGEICVHCNKCGRFDKGSISSPNDDKAILDKIEKIFKKELGKDD